MVMVKDRIMGWVEVGMVWEWIDNVKVDVQKDVPLTREVN